MALDYRFDIKLVVENALYEHMTLKEIEEIRQIINDTIDNFIKENNIK